MSKAWFVAFAVAMVGLPAAVTPAADAAPLPAAPSETLVKTVLAKVDGDNTSDTVKLFSLGSNAYRLQVTTKTGKTSSVTFTSVLPDYDTNGPFVGAAKLDGVKGRELLIRLQSPDEYGSATMAIYTWRNGKLARETAPAAPQGRVWTLADGTITQHGHRFYSWHGRTYVESARLSRSGNFWVGKIVRSVWRKGDWRKLSTRTVKMRAAAANRYLGLSGVEVLLGNVAADIDGDGASDRVDFFRYAEYQKAKPVGRYGVKVMTAKKRTVIKKYDAEIQRIFGAASIDGIAGKELAVQIRTYHLAWRVFTWRKGKLVDAAAVPMCNRATPNWKACAKDISTGVTFSITGGKHYALAAERRNSGNLVTFWKSEWRTNRWVQIDTWSHTFTTEDTDLVVGLNADDMVAP